MPLKGDILKQSGEISQYLFSHHIELYYRGMIEELGAEFSPKTKLSQEADAKLEIAQGELINPGYEYDKILQYLQQRNTLPPAVSKSLSMSISTILKLQTK